MPQAGHARNPLVFMASMTNSGPDRSARWTTRLVAEAVGRTSGCMSDILRAHGVTPAAADLQGHSRSEFAAKVTGCRPFAVMTESRAADWSHLHGSR